MTAVVAVRDAAAFVEAAVRSLLEQTFRDLCVVAVDDGSRDGGVAILERLATEDGRLSVVRNEGVPGVAGALAEGLDGALGEYVARLDADDVALPGRIAEQVAFLDRHPEVGILGTACAVFDHEGEHGVWSMPPTPLEVRWRTLLGNPFLHSTVTFRRSVFVDAGLNYDAGVPVAQDYELWSRALRTTEGANLEAPLVRYRLHDDALTRRRRDEQLAAHDAVALRTIRAELPGVAPSEAQVRDARAFLHGGGQPVDPGASAALVLDLLEAFSREHAPDPGLARLRRSVALDVLRALVRSGTGVRGARLGGRLLRLDPSLPLRAAAVASREALRRASRR